jgi:hypothetical protein
MSNSFSSHQFDEIENFYNQWKNEQEQSCDSHDLIKAYTFESEFLVCAVAFLVSAAKECKSDDLLFSHIQANYINLLDAAQIVRFAEKYLSFKLREMQQLQLALISVNGLN